MLIYQTMSQDERLHEAVSDFKEIYDERLGKLMERNRRSFALAKKFPVVITSSIKSGRNNRWSVTVLARSKQEAKHPGFMMLLKYRTSHGVGFLYPKMVDSYTMDVAVYDFTPHLVSRYKERFLKADADDEQLLENFMVDIMLRNMPLHVAYNEERKYYAAFVQDGMFLSNQCNPHRYIQWRTFVSEDMMFDEQSEEFNVVRGFRERYLEHAAQTGQYAEGSVHLGDDGLPLMYGKHKRGW